jgi:hypothetical protein
MDAPSSAPRRLRRAPQAGLGETSCAAGELGAAQDERVQVKTVLPMTSYVENRTSQPLGWPRLRCASCCQWLYRELVKRSGKTISPEGSSYSYKVPHGFLIEDSSEVGSTPWTQYHTGVFSPTDAVAIRVREQPLPGMVADTPSHVLTIERAFIAEVSRWPHPATNWRRTSAGGAPALRYHLNGQTRDGKRQDAEEVAVFNGNHLVYVSCYWAKESTRDLALKGCKDVLDSLRVENVAAPAS